MHILLYLIFYILCFISYFYYFLCILPLCCTLQYLHCPWSGPDSHFTAGYTISVVVYVTNKTWTWTWTWIDVVGLYHIIATWLQLHLPGKCNFNIAWQKMSIYYWLNLGRCEWCPLQTIYLILPSIMQYRWTSPEKPCVL